MTLSCRSSNSVGKSVQDFSQIWKFDHFTKDSKEGVNNRITSKKDVLTYCFCYFSASWQLKDKIQDLTEIWSKANNLTWIWNDFFTPIESWINMIFSQIKVRINWLWYNCELNECWMEMVFLKCKGKKDNNYKLLPFGAKIGCSVLQSPPTPNSTRRRNKLLLNSWCIYWPPPTLD